MDNTTAAAEPTEKKSESFVPRTTDGFIGRICKIESKRGIIMCLTTVVLAIVFIVLALTSKIGMMDYSLSIPIQTGKGDDVKIEYSEHYSVDMSIFSMFYAMATSWQGKVEYDDEGNEIKKEDTKFEKEVKKAQAAAQDEYQKWLIAHAGAGAEEQARSRAEIYKKHYEEAGVFDGQNNLY